MMRMGNQQFDYDVFKAAYDMDDMVILSFTDRHPGYYKVMGRNEHPYENSYASDES